MSNPVNCAIVFLHTLTNAIEEETNVSWGDEFMTESGFMGDDEEEISYDDSNNDNVEFFSVHQIERDDSLRQSTVSHESFYEGLESEYDLESVVSDEGVPLESCDSSTYNSSDSDSDYATEKNEVNEQDFHHADIEEILVDDNDVDGATELRNFLATFVTNKNLSGSAGNYLLKGLKALNRIQFCLSNMLIVFLLPPTLQLWPVAFILHKIFLVPNVFNCEEAEEGGERYVAFPLLMENKIE